jgi:hypothetical protein
MWMRIDVISNIPDSWSVIRGANPLSAYKAIA